ncbi:MAG: hypothetical protein GY849_07630 [Deltaproteobacteria bacterium]|nr:hypothetical protein [Deltaproteobacteria bacterium]
MGNRLYHCNGVVLFSKKTDIIVFPEVPGRVKRFRLPRSLLPLSLLFLASWAACLFLLFWDYHATRVRISSLARLEKEAGRSQMRLSGLGRQIDRFARDMDEYEEFALHVENLLDLETGLSSPPFPGMGGSEAVLWKPDGAKDGKFTYQVQLLHRSVDEMNERMNGIEQGQKACRTFMVNRKLVLAMVRPPWPKKRGKTGITPDGDGPVIQSPSLSSRSPQPLPSFP